MASNVEDQQHLLSAAEKDMPLRQLREEFKPQDAVIENLCGTEIGRVKDGFQDALRCHVAALRVRLLAAISQPGLHAL